MLGEAPVSSEIQPPFAMNKRYGLRKLGAIGVVHARLADNRSKFKAAPADEAFCLQRIAYSVSTPINRERIGRSFSTLMRIALFQILVRLRLAIFPNPNHRTFNANSVFATIVTIFFRCAAPSDDFNVQRCTWQKIVFLIRHFSCSIYSNHHHHKCEQRGARARSVDPHPNSIPRLSYARGTQIKCFECGGERYLAKSSSVQTAIFSFCPF